MSLRQWVRQFPFVLDLEPCPECDGVLERTRVRDPATQAHWRGVEALACDSCDYAERLPEPGS